MRVDLLEVRDTRYWPGPWYRWVLLDVDKNEAVGYFEKRHDAESEMLRWIEEDEAGDEDEEPGPHPCTCTIACTPQGITDDQRCRLR